MIKFGKNLFHAIYFTNEKRFLLTIQSVEKLALVDVW